MIKKIIEKMMKSKISRVYENLHPSNKIIIFCLLLALLSCGVLELMILLG